MRKYYSGITFFKLAGSLTVLVAHVILFRYLDHLPHTQMNFIFNASKVIVPCFYMISGFLVYKGWSNAADSRLYIRRYLMSLGWVYVFFNLFFWLEFIVPAVTSGGLSPGNLFLQLKIAGIAFFLNGPFIQLWFIPPLLFGVWMSYLLYTRMSLRSVVTLTLLVYLIAQLLVGTLRIGLDSIAGGLSFLDSSYGNYLELFAERYLGYGLTFVSAGVLMGRYEEKFLQVRAIPLSILAASLLVVETLLLFFFADWNSDYSLSLSMISSTILLFYGILRIKMVTIQKYHPFINGFSKVIFFGHIPLMKLNVLLGVGDLMGVGIVQGLVYLLVTLLECLALTYLFEFIYKSPNSVYSL
ncbi:acyltransferase family protein [Paenibacillus wynnii]|uniref:Acyltransferase 3 domain-containing protein n=1 Tax=Paenibacillus wynnii TaxID=268407 RepID=A0A098MBC1_9BACL|nr:acyltransferase family protein [Paenibacillus wynnii]KGE19348.1 hypothetical protein PWYN_08355 [Paenibacillus wynnii]